MKLFTANDFRNLPMNYSKAAEALNAILQERLLSKAKRVYGTWAGVYRHFGESLTDKLQATHEALLIDEKEIVKECVEHEPKILGDLIQQVLHGYGSCKHCGKALKAKWEVVE